MAKFALLLSLSVLASTSAQPTVLNRWQSPAIPPEADEILAGIQTITGSTPKLVAEISDTAAEGQAPKLEATISITDGSFSLPFGAGIPITLPSSAETVLTFVEGSTGTKPEIQIDAEIIELPAAEAVPAAPAVA